MTVHDDVIRYLISYTGRSEAKVRRAVERIERPAGEVTILWLRPRVASLIYGWERQT